MFILSVIISTLLFSAYLLWGWHTLRVRYVYHEELSLRAELTTLGAVVLFYFVEFSLMKGLMNRSITLYLVSGLAIAVSGAALYGPMLVSVAARLFVDAFHPIDRGEVHTPHYGPAESLEEIGDWEGAVNEYKVVARIFPQDAEPLLRAAKCWMELEKNAEAARAFERALGLVHDEEDAVIVTNRVADLYMQRLDQPKDAERVLRDYIENYPDSERTGGIQRRLDRLNRPAERPSTLVVSDALEIPEIQEREAREDIEERESTPSELELEDPIPETPAGSSESPSDQSEVLEIDRR